jgi:hypothetical protein
LSQRFRGGGDFRDPSERGGQQEARAATAMISQRFHVSEIRLRNSAGAVFT